MPLNRSVIPAEAGIQVLFLQALDFRSPIRSRTSFTGMTQKRVFLKS
jgi:hypothetical protein